ncbi:zinc-binding dehydrogenase [Streptomyces sp. NRRL S-340]|uniref:zinc-binding dehydrogenase n=1 Tax=Streptomyces sp. NRRL S-340 TaxID=1463901 RepID=UPI000A6B541D|nr:zinc-binding dehydrogenase [Streptomyces sp. NRRL S-340]
MGPFAGGVGEQGPAGRELALRRGATHAFAPDEAAEAVRDLTGGGAEVAIEAAGSPRVVAACPDTVGRGGTVVPAGLPAPGRTPEVPAPAFAGEHRRLLHGRCGAAPRHPALPRPGASRSETSRGTVYPLPRPRRPLKTALEELAQALSSRSRRPPAGQTGT